MKKRHKVYIGIAVVIGMSPFIIIGWIASSSVLYGHEARVQCADFDFWEDTAQCAANIAIQHNDPRYCEIHPISETVDACMYIYSENTPDGTTCKKIIDRRAKDNCFKRFE